MPPVSKLTRNWDCPAAIVCVSLYTVIKRGGAKLQQRMQFDQLLDEVSFVSSILKLDMIFKQGGVESNTLRTIRWLAENNVLEVTDDGWIGLTDAERACGRENYGTTHLYTIPVRKACINPSLVLQISCAS